MDAATSKGPWHDPPAGRGSRRVAAHPSPRAPQDFSVAQLSVPTAVHVPPSGTPAAGTHGGLPLLTLCLCAPFPIPLHPPPVPISLSLISPPCHMVFFAMSAHPSFLPPQFWAEDTSTSCGLLQHRVEQDTRTGDSKDPMDLPHPRLTKQGDCSAGRLWVPIATALLCLPHRCPQGRGLSASIALGLQRDPRSRGMRASKDAFGGTPPAGRATRGLQEPV